MINVTKSFLPDIDNYVKYLQQVWDTGHLTNHGPLVNELEEKLKTYLGVKHFFFVNNGTIAIQIAIKALDLSGEIITTPFSYVATTSSIAWENLKPVFVDIDESSLTIDASKIEASITPSTTAILATHVYGIPCNVTTIEEIAKRKQLKVIYDAAHAFGVKYGGTNVLNFGDVSTLSFHATKLFHTVEGGGIATNDDEIAHQISYMRNFGHKGQEDFWGIGINGKSSEFHAAMGLCIYPEIENIIEKRKNLSQLYDKYFAEANIELFRPSIDEKVKYNFAYYPVLFESERQLLAVRDALNASYIYPRRYFYPSLNRLPYVDHTSMPIAESVSSRVVCLPLYHDLSRENIKRIVTIIADILKHWK
ncbi:MAG: DegT/DnrJ/EryC1/StrS family aminotransferase [Bacteroidetes bacterium]|nr:DegT/DnrJ/EryC1/StrS family aminotransferase [Bacteroidota bacterium]